jgi:hypothetical protein
MDRRTQQDYISWRAPELARSGHFRNWSEIVRQLRYEGAYAAHFVLMAPFKRETLNRLCNEARKSDIHSMLSGKHGEESMSNKRAVDFLQRWISSLIIGKHRHPENIDHSVAECISDAELEGISKAELEDAAGGNLRAFLFNLIKKEDDA